MTAERGSSGSWQAGVRGDPAGDQLPRLEDRFRGALLGTLTGDALGMPVEGWTRLQILREFGEVREMFDARRGAGTYTDDTQMTAALAMALLESDDPSSPDPEMIAQHFADRFDPRRGYGGNTSRILMAIRSGAAPSETIRRYGFPGGSYANGAAMRVAPVALACYPDPVATVRAAEVQSRATGHDHPEARFGARLQAAGVLSGLTAGPAQPPPAPRHLLSIAEEQWQGEPPEAFRARLNWIESHADASPEEAERALGTGLRAAEAVPAALWAFLRSPDDPEEALVRAVALGGDADTIAAMAGALVGARCGASRIPGRWLAAVERGAEGHDGLVALAELLHRRATGSDRKAGHPGPDARGR
jgi:poly(ADP-ribose) glycohydrolase ARH3